jgi:hypothetical protein
MSKSLRVRWLGRVFLTASLCWVVASAGCGSDQPDRDAGPAGGLPADLVKTVTLPIDCGGIGVVKVIDERFDFDGDGTTDSILGVRCDAGAGSPPTGVYAVRATAAGPKVVGTLVSPEEGLVVRAVTAAPDGVRIEASGYSEDAPRCCPDLDVSYRFQWNGTTFEQLERNERPASPAAEPPQT